MADPAEPNKPAGRPERWPIDRMQRLDARLRADRLLRRDVRHSLAISALAVLLSAGLLYFACLGRVCWIAARSSQRADRAARVLVFGKRLLQGEPDADYRRRLQHACSLARQRCDRQLILLGGGPPGASEAVAGLLTLHAWGLPADASVQLEDRSLDTLENLRNARELLGAERTAPVLLLSNRYHLARCLSLARLLGFDARPCPAEATFSLREQRPLRLLQEAAFLCWLEVGTAWARLIGHRRMLNRIS
jgi:uncharacterized SAM-binding protein YcdF (DUF218 family)